MQDKLSLTFTALSDPTRRAILARLSHGEATVQELAKPFQISAPAITKHLKVLEKAGLISRGRDAQYRPCRIETESLKEASLGDPIAAEVAAVNPSYSVRYQKPAVSIYCGPVSKTFEIASVLGFERNLSSVLAPYDADFELPCRHPSKIVFSLPYSHSVIREVYIKEEPAVELEWAPSGI